GKKSDKKIKGTITAMEETKKDLENLLIKKGSIEMEIDFLIKKPKKKWYEKFRWFESSDGFLVIGGRDASSNEAIFKKYIETHDLVLHTTFPGSPLTIIKNPENKQIPENTIMESADFTASFSKAWKEAWGVVDVFYINPNQVSKSPPSGEYLPKGSFMISGKKNFIKNAKTELAIGLKLVELEAPKKEKEQIYYPKIIVGPLNAIKKVEVEDMIIIRPSKSGLTSGKLAKKIKQRFIDNSNEDFRKFINLISLDEIILSLPNGISIISKN
ncbi:MAG: NFACT RNA binding domain-containing protein, partial [Candidatus Hermodarchaeota archaeon]